MTTRTLYGLDALGWALLHGLKEVLVDENPSPLYAARRLNPLCLDSITVAADVGPHPWPQAHIDAMLDGRAFIAQNAGFGLTMAHAAQGEFDAAGRLAAEQRALYDTSDAGKIDRLERALAAVVACEDDVETMRRRALNWASEPEVMKRGRDLAPASDVILRARSALIALRKGRGLTVDENWAVRS